MDTRDAGRMGGQIGGKATGAAKRRGDSDHYRAIRALRPSSTRAARAAERLARLRAEERPEHRQQALDDWLELATAAEVRRAWRKSWGALPPWARA